MGMFTDAERYVLSRIRDSEPLSWMHRRALWLAAERGCPVILPSRFDGGVTCDE